MDGSQTPDFSRRGFIVAALSAAGGLAIGVPFEAMAKQSANIAGEENPKELTAWLVIDPDNTVTVRVPHQEMGQGTATALAMLVAEELECDWAKVRFEHASANRNQREGMIYKGMMTVGSQGVRTSVSMMQQAGASARERLRLAAAQAWKADPADCVAADGKVTLKGGKSLTYGALAPAAAKVVLPAEPTIRTPAQYKHAGKWTPRLDTPAKLDGSAQFGIDAKVPGMVYAAVSACPVFGGKLKSANEAAIKGRRGIIAVVKEDEFVAVVADRYWRARAALADLPVEWDVGDSGKVQQAGLDKFYRDATDGELIEVQKEGDLAAAFAAPGAKIVEALYEVPYLSHSPMEPMNCTVAIAPDRVDVWISTQAPMNVLKMAAEGTGLPQEQVFVHNNFVGGGFGRRGQNDELPQAIKVAKAVGKPVKLIWTREEDILRDRYRPQAAVRFKAALGEGGKATAFESRIAVGPLLPVTPGKIEPMATECIARSPYTFPARRIAAATPKTHVPVQFWRGVGGSQNGFFLESFVDEMALAAGQDPLAFRRGMLDRPEMLAVLDVMADKGNWGQPLEKGRGRGMAILETYASISGQVVEVSVSKSGELVVDRVVAVIDCYNAVNPNTISQQMEGAVIFALSAALYGEITIKDGAAEQSNFDSYQLVRMNDMPKKIEVHLPLSGGTKWGGIGEPGVAPLAPALCNAIFAATGKRIRRLPVRNTDLSRA